jgi:hypothetical protein
LARVSIAAEPKDFLLWCGRANILALLDRLEEAHEAVQRVKSIVPTWTLALYKNGVRAAWRNRDDVVEPQLAGLRKLDID